MKSILILLAAFILLLVALTYILIPGNIAFQQSAVLKANIKGLQRSLSDNKHWAEWWPGTINTNEKKLQFNGNVYSLSYTTQSSVLVNIKNSYASVNSEIIFIPLLPDSVKLEWRVNFPTSLNPVSRLMKYLKTDEIKHDVGKILKSLTAFYTSTKSIYSIDIRREVVKDSFLISTYDSVKGFPSTEKIYSLVSELRGYISSQQASQTDSPMLNIYTKNNVDYLVKVAIPTNRKLPSNGKIMYRWMLGGGNILSADVQGGWLKTGSAFTFLENYVSDHSLAAPAIPFYSLLTNRLAEPDSNKWLTRIYYPVMYYKD